MLMYRFIIVGREGKIDGKVFEISRHVNFPIKINHLSFVAGDDKMGGKGKPFAMNVVEKYRNMTNILNHSAFASLPFTMCIVTAHKIG